MAGETKFTPGPIAIRKCQCGDPICDQHTLSTQGSVGFSLADATLYAAAPDLYEALACAIERLRSQNIGRGTMGGSCACCGHTWMGEDEAHRDVCPIGRGRVALAKATGNA